MDPNTNSSYGSSPDTTTSNDTIPNLEVSEPPVAVPEVVIISPDTSNSTEAPDERATDESVSEAAAAAESAPIAATPDVLPPTPIIKSTTTESTVPTVTNTSVPSAGVVSGGKASGKKKKKLFVGVLAVVLVVLLGGGYAFAFYLPNTPANVYKTGLSRTSEGYTKLVSYLNDTQSKHYKGYDSTGSFNFAVGSASGDGMFTTHSNGGNGTSTINVDIAGEKFVANTRSVQPAGQNIPDIYLQVTGVKSMLDGFGLNNLDTLDGQWISVDHTVLEGLANSASGRSKTMATSPTQAQIQDALSKLGTVNSQYLFSTGKQAVLQEKKYLGKSTEDGRSVYGYQVGYDKANLKAYVKAASDAVNSSSLNTWVKQATGKTVSDLVNLNDANKAIDGLSSGYAFNLFVDADTKLIHQVRFSQSVDPLDNYFNLGLNYTGGSNYPFVFEFHDGKDPTGPGDFKLSATLNTDTSKLSFNFVATGTDNGSKIDVTANAAFTPSNNPVTVTAPTGAKPILEVLNGLGLGSLLSGDTGTADQSAAASNLLTLTQ